MENSKRGKCQKMTSAVLENPVFCLKTKNLFLIRCNGYDVGGILPKYSEAIRLDQMQVN